MADERLGVVRGFPGEAKAEAEGLLNQAAGAAKDAYSKTVDAAAEGAQVAKDAAIAGSDALRDFVEERPYTTAALALGMGLLIGLMSNRPPPRRSWWD